MQIKTCWNYVEFNVEDTGVRNVFTGFRRSQDGSFQNTGQINSKWLFVDDPGHITTIGGRLRQQAGTWRAQNGFIGIIREVFIWDDTVRTIANVDAEAYMTNACNDLCDVCKSAMAPLCFEDDPAFESYMLKYDFSPVAYS